MSVLQRGFRLGLTVALLLFAAGLLQGCGQSVTAPDGDDGTCTWQMVDGRWVCV